MQKERGCARDSEIPGYWSFGRWKFSRCPLKVVKEESFRYIQAYNFYKDKFFPNPGTWSEQPMKLLEAIQFIQRETNREKEERRP
jgi:hypothetical protein